jgi:phage baseplate assembly protein W
VNTAEVPHFAFPFRLENGSVAVQEQDTTDEVAQCVQVLLATPLGERDEQPDYGITDPTFQADIDQQEILTAVAEWEPRAIPALTDETDNEDELVRTLRATVAESEG